MWPLIELPFGVALRSYSVLLLLAVVVCWAIGPRWVGALEGIDGRATRGILVWLGVAAFMGGRGHFVASYWHAFAGSPLAMGRFWQGLHAGGAVIAMSLALPPLCRWYRVPLGKFADDLMPTIGVGIVIARLGCFLEGCCFGTRCAEAWCLAFPPGSHAYAVQAGRGILPPGAALSLPVHPLQLYFAGVALLMSVGTVWFRRRKRFDGEPALLGLLLLSVGGAVLESFRYPLPLRPYWGPLPQLQWLALMTAAATVVVLVATELRCGRAPGRMGTPEHPWRALG